MADQVAVLGASAAFGRRSPAAHQRKVFEAVQVLAASFQDVGACSVAVVYDLVEAGIDSVDTEEAESRCMSHFGNWEAHSGPEAEARFETAVDQFEIDWVVHSGKEAVHSGTAVDH